MRRIVAMVAAFGFVSSICIFISSFIGATMEKLLPMPIVLHIGIIALVASVVGFERFAGIKPNLSWKEFKARTPDWVIFGLKLLFLLFCIIFVLFLILSRFASPKIHDGDYVLSDHGRIAAVLTKTEYLFLKGWELRFFASGWTLAYFFLMMYWWFPMSGQHSD